MVDINKDYLEPKRSNTTTKEEIYMLLALIAASNSKDPSTQVGACYVSEDNKVLSVGCNKAPWNDDEFPWGKNKEHGIINTKHPYVIHAELSAVSDYSGSVNDFKNGTLYVTLFPCTNCAKLIASLGIKRLVYLNVRDNCDEFNCASILLRKSNVECINFRNISNNPIQSIELDMNANEKENIKIIRKQKVLTNC